MKSVPEQVDELSRKIAAAKGEDYLKTFVKSQGAKSSFALLVPLSIEVDRLERVGGRISVPAMGGAPVSVESREQRIARLQSESETETNPVRKYEMAKEINEIYFSEECPAAQAYAATFTDEPACARAYSEEKDPTRQRALFKRLYALRGWELPQSMQSK